MRSLPIIEIDNVEFCMDVDREALWQRDNPRNQISFNDIQPSSEGPGYTFIYDRLLRNVARDFPEEIEAGRYLKITLPALMELDPEGLSLKYGIPLELLATGREARIPRKIIAESSPFTLSESI